MQAAVSMRPCMQAVLILVLTATCAQGYWGPTTFGLLATKRSGEGLLPAWRHRAGFDVSQGASTARTAKAIPVTVNAADSVDGGAHRNRRRGLPSALDMAKTTKEGDVVLKSVKVGPLKQENVLLQTGVSMEVLSQAPSSGAPKRSPLPPLVFIHGSYHAAWCWGEHWMPFLASKGYETYSISLRGTSGTPPPGLEGENSGQRVKVKVSEHVSDIRSFVETVLAGRRPVYIGHSFGGMVLLKLMETLANDSAVNVDGEGNREGVTNDATTTSGIKSAMAGGVFLCSVPPAGNDGMTKRFMKERPVAVLKLVLGFVLKMAVFWPWLARDLFFSQSLEQSALRRYMTNFKADSKHGLDLTDLRSHLPSEMSDAEGKATWIQDAPPRLVIGAERDRCQDEEGAKETATFLDTTHIMLPTAPHDVMLGPDWPLGVARVLQWLEATDFQLSPTT